MSAVVLAQPVILASTRNRGVAVPPVRGAVALVREAREQGWRVGLTYVRAHVPQGCRQAPESYVLHSVGVRLERGEARGWACWYQVGDRGWRFNTAHLDGRRVGPLELARLLEAIDTPTTRKAQS